MLDTIAQAAVDAVKPGLSVGGGALIAGLLAVALGAVEALKIAVKCLSSKLLNGRCKVMPAEPVTKEQLEAMMSSDSRKIREMHHDIHDPHGGLVRQMGEVIHELKTMNSNIVRMMNGQGPRKV